MLLLSPFVQMRELKESLSDSFKGLELVRGRPGFRSRQQHTNCHAENHFAILVLELEHQSQAYFCHDLAVHLSEPQLPPLENGKNTFCSVGRLEDQMLRPRACFSGSSCHHNPHPSPHYTRSSSLAEQSAAQAMLLQPSLRCFGI